MNMNLTKLVLNLIVNLISGFCGVDTNAIIFFFKLLNNGQGFLHKGLESKFNGFRVIVRTSAGFWATDDAFSHDVIGAVEVKKVPNNNIVGELFLELLPVFSVSRESIDQITPVAISYDVLLE